jgi:ribonuclease P protein component
MKWTKNHRLRKRWQFQNVQQRGSRKRASCFLVLYLPSSENQSRVGITVSKKVGNAVVRNRVKRWIREAARMEYPILKGFWDIVVIAYPQSKSSSLVQIKLDIHAVFQFLSRKSQ